jgi:BirA family biotin operon repressor/biotin-[acetyl-CoA-carboxylase] ligase
MVSAMWAGEWEIRPFAEIDSTNTYVRDQARQGAAEGLVAVAEHQTAGRGRLDRRWESPPGANLLASVLLRPACEAGDLHLCTGAVALAAAGACGAVAGVDPDLKWPNDLLVGGAKLAGVLAEAEFAGGRLEAVVVGIGINVAWPGPAGAGGTCLDEAGGSAQPVDKAQLLDRMLEGLALWRPLLDDEAGRRDLADEVRRRCATLGQRVRVTRPNDELTGVASAIDDAGHLVVETPSGSQLVRVGDVVHLRPG